MSLLILTLLAPCTAVAQQQAAEPRAAPATLARFVAPSAGLFIEFDRLSEMDRRLAVLSSAALKNFAQQSDEAPSCPAAVALHLGVPADEASRQVFAGHVALAAEDWERFADAVVLIDVTDSAALEHLLGLDRQAPVPVNSAPRALRSASGVWVALGGGSAALSRRAADESPLFAQIAARLSGADEPVLSASGAFRRQMEALPPRALGRIYVDVSGEPGDAQASLFSSVQRCAAGLYRRGKAVELELRTEITPSRALRAGERAAIERVLALPQTTLLAWATAVDLPALIEEARHTRETGLAAALAAFVANLAGGEQAGSWLSKLGPRVILVWGQKNDAAASAPELGLLMESPSAGEVADALRILAESWLATLDAMRPGPSDAALSLRHDEYLGTDIWSIPLGSLIATPGQQPGPLGWLASVTPSFAAVGDWLVIALSTAHLKEMIDAAHDVIPTLRVIPGVQQIDDAARRGLVYAVAQPGMAAQVVNGWLADLDASRPSPLDQHWWSGAEASDTPLHIGIGMDRKSEAGRVVVARVHRGLPADGRVQVGDRIIGVDDRLLSLSTPNDDLRTYVQGVGERKSLTLRVMRQDQMLDVVLPMAMTRRLDALEPLRNISALLRDVGSATYSVTVTGERQMSARLTLRVAE